MTNYLEQTEIARKLGISNNSFKRIVFHGKLEFKLINAKRNYKFSEVLEAIKKANNIKEL